MPQLHNRPVAILYAGTYTTVDKDELHPLVARASPPPLAERGWTLAGHGRMGGGA
jgi:hypothetical protein